jgi:chitin synthase
MYRLFDARDASANQHPVTLFACDYVYDRYARNDAVIETLHEKNLYKLGEDRMLTTLMLQKWSRMNLKYVPEAHCYTIVPDEFMVLLSQRRRWINSTFHNMLYLLSVNLGGICCFSMKFILVLDMIGTLILPSSLLYLGMILYDSIMDRNSVSTYTLLVLGFSVFVQIIGPLLRLKIKYLWYAFVFCEYSYSLFAFVGYEVG